MAKKIEKKTRVPAKKAHVPAKKAAAKKPLKVAKKAPAKLMTKAIAKPAAKPPVKPTPAPPRPAAVRPQQTAAPIGNYRKQRKWAPGKLQHMLDTIEVSAIRREIGSAVRGALTASELVSYLLTLEKVVPAWREARERRSRGEFIRGGAGKKKLTSEEAKAASIKAPAPVVNATAALDHAANGGLLPLRGEAPKPPARPALAPPKGKIVVKKKAA